MTACTAKLCLITSVREQYRDAHTSSVGGLQGQSPVCSHECVMRCSLAQCVGVVLFITEYI